MKTYSFSGKLFKDAIYSTFLQLGH